MPRRQGFWEILARSNSAIGPLVAIGSGFFALMSLGILPAIIVVGIVFVSYRFTPILLRFARKVAPPDPGTSDRPGFRGLIPYTAGELLPGRTPDIRDCHAKLHENNFFVLAGEPGCGKSSLLDADLIPYLQGLSTVSKMRVHSDPFGNLARAIPELTGSENRAATKNAETGQAPKPAPSPDQPVTLVIDQFEELFAHSSAETRTRFLRTLLGAIRTGHIRLVLVLRSDYLDLLSRHLLDTGDPAIALTQSNYHELRAFHKDMAVDVTKQILAEFTEDSVLRREEIFELAEVLAHDLLRPPRDARVPKDPWTVLPAELQSLGSMLQRTGAAALTAAEYRRRGSRRGLTQEFLTDVQQVVQRITGLNGTIALEILQVLSPSGVREAKTASELAKVEQFEVLGKENLQRVLNALEEHRVIRRFSESDEMQENNRYEVIHDFLAELIQDAPDPFLISTRAGHDRLQMWLSQKSALQSTSSAGGWRRFTPTMPLSEVWHLRRFAHAPEARSLIRENVRAYQAQLAVAVAILGIGGGAGILIKNSDFMQRSLTRSAAVELVAQWDPQVDTTYIAYIATVAKEERFDDALTAFRGSGLSEGDRARLFAAAADTLMRDGYVDASVAILFEAVRSGYTEELDRRDIISRIALHLGKSAPDSIFRLANAAVTKPQRASILIQGARGLAQAGADRSAHQALVQGYQLYLDSPVWTLSDSIDLVGQLARVAYAAHRANDAALAEQVMGEVTGLFARMSGVSASAGAEVALMYASMGQTSDASKAFRRMAGRMTLMAPKGHVAAIVRHLAANGHLSDVVWAIHVEYPVEELPVFAIETLADAGQVEQAFQLLRAVPDGSVRRSAGARLGRQRLRNGDSAGARQALVSFTILPEDPDSAQTFKEGIVPLFLTGERGMATSLAHRLDRVMPQGKDRSSLDSVAVLYAQLGLSDSAVAYADNALNRCEVLALLAKHWLDTGTRDLALRVLEPLAVSCISDTMALPVAKAIVAGGPTGPGWARIASLQEGVGNRAAAEVAVELANRGYTHEALAILPLTRDRYYRAQAQAAIGAALVRSNGVAAAKAMIADIPSVWAWQDQTYIAMGARYAEAGNIRAANRVAWRCQNSTSRLQIYTAILEHSNRRRQHSAGLGATQRIRQITPRERLAQPLLH